jgi:hypothetical protein
VETKLLDTEKVLSAWQAGWDGGSVVSSEWPGDWVEGWALLPDLEPDLSGTVEAGGGAWCLRHVNGNWAVVVDWGVCAEGEAGTCSNGGSSGGRAWATALVTSHVVGGDIGDRRVVVGVLADVLVNCTLDSAGSELVEDVCLRISILSHGLLRWFILQ